MNMSNERDQLRAAIEQHNEALEDVAKAEEALARANARYAELQMRSGAFTGLDADMKKARAERMKLALAEGDEHLPNDSSLPEFSVKIIARDTLQSEMTALAETIETLENDLTAARDDAALLNLRKAQCAEQVFGAEIGAIASNFEATLLNARRMLYMLRSACLQQIPRAVPQPPPSLMRNGVPLPSISALYNAPTKPARLPPLAVELAHEDILGSHERRYGFALRNEATDQVRAFWLALLCDPDAELTQEHVPELKTPDAAE